MNYLERLRSLRWLFSRVAYPVGRIYLKRVPKINRAGKKTELVLARGVRIYEGVRFFLDADKAVIYIGQDTYLNRRVEIMCQTQVHIGDRCAIGWDVSITDTDYHEISPVLGTPLGMSQPVHIGDHVWIGARAVILKGVYIGDGAVIAAGAVVTRDVQPATLVAGVPAEAINVVTWK